MPGDIITRIGHRAVLKPTDVGSALALHRPGQSVSVHAARDDRTMTVTLVLE